MAQLIADVKPLAGEGKTLVAMHIDSWEAGPGNWTPRFREEFKKRRGYDPLRFLPILTDRVLDNLEVSERFLWDFRQTISDLIVENYAGHMQTLAHQHGLRLSIEGYDGSPCDDMTYAARADVPMGEFWCDTYQTKYSCTEMASTAHVYGKKVVQAEAFTSETFGPKGGWYYPPPPQNPWAIGRSAKASTALCFTTSPFNPTWIASLASSGSAFITSATRPGGNCQGLITGIWPVANSCCSRDFLSPTSATWRPRPLPNIFSRLRIGRNATTMAVLRKRC
jgi:hypothetical protein